MDKVWPTCRGEPASLVSAQRHRHCRGEAKPLFGCLKLETTFGSDQYGESCRVDSRMLRQNLQAGMRGPSPEGNGCVECAIRTLKEQLLWVRSFETVEELRVALLAWAELYNEQWLIERYGFKPHAQRRRDYYAESEKMAA